MRTILTIIKKEFARFFKDTRLMITAIFLPGLLIFCVYSIMGTVMSNVDSEDEGKPPVAYVQELPASQQILSQLLDIKTEYSVESAKAAVKDGKLDLAVIFPQDFDEWVSEYEVGSGSAPNVEIYYCSSNTTSFTAYTIVSAVLSEYENTIANKFDVNRPASPEASFDLADNVSTTRMVLSMVVPMVLLMLLFSGCMAVAPESIAGEKERGTIATLLVTPLKRSHLAIGKIAALSVMALLSGLSSTIGMLLSLPKLMGGSGVEFTLSMFGFGDIMAVLAVILSTVLILVTLISIISAYAKSVKEASGLVVPVMILVMICGIMSMFAGAAPSIGLFFIPVFNSALAISSVMSGAICGAAVAVTVCTNVAFSALLVFLLTLMFKSEKIMFNK